MFRDDLTLGDLPAIADQHHITDAYGVAVDALDAIAHDQRNDARRAIIGIEIGDPLTDGDEEVRDEAVRSATLRPTLTADATSNYGILHAALRRLSGAAYPLVRLAGFEPHPRAVRIDLQGYEAVVEPDREYRIGVHIGLKAQALISLLAIYCLRQQQKAREARA